MSESGGAEETLKKPHHVSHVRGLRMKLALGCKRKAVLLDEGRRVWLVGAPVGADRLSERVGGKNRREGSGLGGDGGRAVICRAEGEGEVARLEPCF